VTAEQDERLREQAARVSPTDVVRVLDLIAVGLRAMKDGSDARTQLELALVKAALPKVDASAKALQSRLERLEAGRPAAAPAAGRHSEEPGGAGHRRRPRRAQGGPPGRTGRRPSGRALERRTEGSSGRARRAGRGARLGGGRSGRLLARCPRGRTSGRPVRPHP
jgi:DNA polymerase-3 subunit gamma/tau